MASITKRPDGKWRARYRDEAGKEHSRHFPRRVDGQRWLDEVTASVVTGQYVDPKAGRITFKQWSETYQSRQVWARGTGKNVRMVLDAVPFGDVRLVDLRASHVQAWVKLLSSTVAPITAKSRFTILRTCLRAAVRERLIAASPADDVKPPRVKSSPEVAMRIPTPSLVAAALDTAPVHFRPFIAVCAFAGLRLSEASGLQVSDVDFLRRTITVQRQAEGASNADVQVSAPKWGSSRVVYVAEELTDMLAAHISDVGTWGSEGWLFSNGGILWSRNAAGFQFRQLRQQVDGLEPFTLHSLRHFFASGLIASGCDVVTVQRQLGHSQPSMTLNVYSHLWPDAEERTRTAVAGLMSSVPADCLRTDTTLTAL